ncbi:MAG: MCP four helix bundle domain-containing protein, partial [Burkholderiaceae bacterium]|nr:MCP four helix bundle domain-containing protein [Burkholderiaceae bacterium]
MKNLAISTRLWLAVLLVVVSLGAVVGFAAQRNQMTQQESALRMAALDERLTLASEWRRQTDANVVRNLALMLSNEPALQSVFQAESAAVIEQITRLNQQIAALPLSEHEKKLLAAVATERAAVLDIRKKILAVRAQADSAEEAARLLNTEFLPQRDRYVRALSDFVGAQQQAQVALRLELKARSAQTVVIASAAVVLVLVLIVLGAVFLIRSIRDPLARSVQMAEAIANGDLTQDIRTTRRDEFGQLTLALAHMNQSLGKLVQQVQQASDSIQVASSEVAAGTQDLASRTEAAASSLEQTASSME